MIFGVGEADFALLRESDSYYVDKTEIIYELVQKTNNKVTLFTRPRRFGKTLMMSMIENFFSARKNSRALFEGLNIMKHEAFCEKYMNKYPVLFISFKDVEALNFDEAYGMLKMVLADFCKKNFAISEETVIYKDDIDIFKRLSSRTADKDEIKNSLKTITRMMNAVYGEKVILLIDEYDVPLARANEMGYYRNMLDVIRGIMSTALKDNEYLKFAVITGCMRIAKESIFTGTNNFVSYSVIDERFSQYFGFSQKEIDTLLKAAKLENKSDVIKEWYDGYVFGSSYVYCPWDVICYVSNLICDPVLPPQNYWQNTSHNGILLSFVEQKSSAVTEKFETLLNGGIIEQKISDTLTYATANESEDNLWSVLLMTGYLTKADANERGDTVHLKIPNKEIAIIFEETVVKYFNDTKDKSLQNTMMKAFFDGDEATATKAISDLLWDTISYHDYNENYYHAFLAGAFTGLGYAVYSNQEFGLGRPDIVVSDRKHRTAIIIEAKKSQKESDMEKNCIEAYEQIITRKYADDRRFDGYEKILCYGIAFFKKKALVKKL